MRGNEIVQGEGLEEMQRVQGLSPQAAHTWRAAEEEAPEVLTKILPWGKPS